MAWTEPTTNNTAETKVTVTTFDEIAANQVYLKERADTVDSSLGQELNTDSDVEFNSVTTDNVAIKHKLFTGTFPDDGSEIETFSHGLYWDNIIHIQASIKWSTGYFYTIPRGSSNVDDFVRFDDSEISIYTEQSSVQGLEYRVLVTYQA